MRDGPGRWRAVWQIDDPTGRRCCGTCRVGPCHCSTTGGGHRSSKIRSLVGRRCGRVWTTPCPILAPVGSHHPDATSGPRAGASAEGLSSTSRAFGGTPAGVPSLPPPASTRRWWQGPAQLTWANTPGPAGDAWGPWRVLTPTSGPCPPPCAPSRPEWNGPRIRGWSEGNPGEPRPETTGVRGRRYSGPQSP